MKAKLWLIAAIIFLLAAAVFAVAMTGHTFVAALCALAAAVIAFYHFVRKRALRIALAALLALGFAVFGVIEAPILKAARTDAPDDVGYLVVLGAGLHGDTPSLSLTDRLNAALDWLEAHPDCVAVVSGGQGPGETMTEGEAMEIWLEARGIDPQRIIVEDRATSTWENLENSFALIRGRGGEPDGDCAIVTSEYHLYRAKAMAEELGVECFGVAGRTSWPTLALNYFIREGFAVTYYRITGEI